MQQAKPLHLNAALITMTARPSMDIQYLQARQHIKRKALNIFKDLLE